MPIALGMGWAVAYGALLFAFASFDRLAELEYEEFPESWEGDGRPFGFFWRPPDTWWFEGGFSAPRLILVWLFRTPDWVLGSTQALDLLRRLRVSALIWNVSALMLFFATIGSAR